MLGCKNNDPKKGVFYLSKNDRKPNSRAPTHVDEIVGQKIRELRLARNMTLAELGSELGISHQQLQKYETGTNRLSAGMLSSVSDALRVPIMSFFEDPDAVDADSNGPVQRARAECHRLIDMTSSEDKLKTMAGVLKAMAHD